MSGKIDPGERMRLMSEAVIEKIARKLAFWHGQKMRMVIDGQAMTVAAMRGYGSFGNSADRYADHHWREYTAAAEWVLERDRESYDSAREEASEHA